MVWGVRKSMKEDRSNKAYWNWRTVEFLNNEQKMIWQAPSWKYDITTYIYKDILHRFQELGYKSFLELGCGFGRFSEQFSPDEYMGVDFSDEMITLARKKYPNHRFEVGDWRDYVPEKKYDVIFEVMITGLHDKDGLAFEERFSPFAKTIIRFHPSNINIKYIDEV